MSAEDETSQDLQRLNLESTRPPPAASVKAASESNVLQPTTSTSSPDDESQQQQQQQQPQTPTSSKPAPPVQARDFAQPSTSRQASPAPGPASGSAAPPKGAQNKLGALRNRPSGSNVPIPPGLREKMAGLNKANNARPPPGAQGSMSAPGVPTMSQSDRLDASAFMGPPKGFPTPEGRRSSSGGGSPGSGPPGLSGPPGGGLMARRQKAGLSAGPPGRMSLENATNGSTGRGAGPSMPQFPQFPSGAAPKRRGPPGGLNLSAMLGEDAAKASSTPFSNFNKIVDPSGRLSFENKAVLHAQGVDFTSGASFTIKKDDLELLEELGRGNYGTVQKVYHKKTKVVMAMKEIRLELDESRLKGIITELDILHRASSSNIVEFYGAFFIESCVYYCMEFMDGSLDDLAGVEVPEPVLSRVTACVVRGLKFLKDELQTMHRDVKPTNVLVSRSGNIKLCDFGVSAQLERSLAKTNIGCQSYMAPERIKGESQGQVGAYSVASDVWSLGLSMIEFAIGHYPYPPETYSNVFAQLQAIVHGDPPALPDGYSDAADDFVAQCLRKEARRRPTYAELQGHPFLQADAEREVDMAQWVSGAFDQRAAKKKEEQDQKDAASAPKEADKPAQPSEDS